MARAGPSFQRTARHPALTAVIVALMMLAGAPTARGAGGSRIILEHVRIPGVTSEADDVRVNILIVDGKLEMVTRDEIPTEKSDTIIDGGDHLVMGELKVDQPANLLILDQDPRKDLDVLLDTKPHLLFAMRNGIIIKNNIPTATPFQPAPEKVAAKEKKKPRLIGYIPPPVALPVSYLTKQHWNQWKTKAVNGIFLGALALDRQKWIAQDGTTRELVGDLQGYSGAEIRAIRFGSIGTFNFEHPWVYTLFLTTKAFDEGYDTTDTTSLKVYDLRLDIPLPKKLTLSVGKQKEPISMERLAGGFYLPLLERAAVLDAMLPTRDVGVTFSRRELNERVTWAAGIYNDGLSVSKSVGASSNTLVGRATWLPYLTEDHSDLLHVGLGLRYSDGKDPVQYRTEAEFKQGPLFVDTGPIQAEHSLTWDLEASWRKGPMWVSGEFLRSFVRAPGYGDPTFSGFNVTASWILGGEMRPYDTRTATFGPVPISRSVYHGGWGTWELATRYSYLDLDDGTVDGGRMGILSVGASWYLTTTFNLRLDYRHIALRREGRRGDSDGFLLRLVLMLN